jgi:Tfp pilus assembly major pilin PilA
MHKILHVASDTSQLFAIAGILAAATILLFRQIIKKNIFATLTKNLSAGTMTQIIKRLSLLALVSMILEVAGFAMSFTHCSTYQFAYSPL